MKYTFIIPSITVNQFCLDVLMEKGLISVSKKKNGYKVWMKVDKKENRTTSMF